MAKPVLMIVDDDSEKHGIDWATQYDGIPLVPVFGDSLLELHNINRPFDAEPFNS